MTPSWCTPEINPMGIKKNRFRKIPIRNKLILPVSSDQAPTRGLQMSDTNVTVDRAAIRQMVEDFWRSQLLYHRNLIDTQPNLTPEQSQEAVFQFVRRFFDRIEATAALMPPEQAETFNEMVQEEYLYLGREFERDRNATLQRFGIGFTSPPSQAVYHRQGIGEMAVRTAVRATIWELIFSLFRR